MREFPAQTLTFPPYLAAHMGKRSATVIVIGVAGASVIGWFLGFERILRSFDELVAGLKDLRKNTSDTLLAIIRNMK